MTISHEMILTLKEYRGFGVKNIQATAEFLASLGGSCPYREEYLDILLGMYHNGRLSRLKEIPSPSALSIANGQARKILDTANTLGIKIVSCFDSVFPSNLLSTVNEKGRPDMPILLYYKGNLSATHLPNIAIIGTRKPSQEGIKAGYFLGEAFAKAGFNIVNGLALGCDTVAHRGALVSDHGSTTAILANGLDSIYPQENASLADAILERGGLLLSEYPPGSPIDRYKLILRDRLQAGLADATLIVQSSISGGTMHTARATLMGRKPLYAVSYKEDIEPEKISGNMYLIHSRVAAPVNAEDIGWVVTQILSSKRTTPKSLPPEKHFMNPTLFD